jgi:hypothetical protein
MAVPRLVTIASVSDVDERSGSALIRGKGHCHDQVGYAYSSP